MVSPKKLLGFFEHRPRWGLSRRGWLVFLALTLGLAALFCWGIHPFLAPTRRVDADLLVVEGWIDDFAIQAAAAEFTNGRYRHVYSVGGPVAGSAAYFNDFQTSASVGADRLKAAGLSPGVVQMVPSRVRTRDRTYGSAVALRDWLREQNIPVSRINVLTEDVHSRRSRLLFEKAFGKNVKVGIISVPSPEYDPDHWWRYSEGVKEVISESAAYLYARFLFHPDN